LPGLSEKQWTFKPAPDRWSVAEVAEHITISESTLFDLVQKRIMTSPRGSAEAGTSGGERSNRDGESSGPKPQSSSTRISASDRPLGGRAGRRWWCGHSHFMDHPTLDGYQWLLLISAHSARHTAQIEEVKADPNFPQN
jgi:hypothetical protein